MLPKLAPSAVSFSSTMSIPGGGGGGGIGNPGGGGGGCSVTVGATCLTREATILCITVACGQIRTSQPSLKSISQNVVVSAWMEQTPLYFS